MRFLFASIALIGSIYANAQLTNISKETYRFPKIDESLLARKAYAIDSGAGAVVLADVGDLHFEGNNRGGFDYYYHRHRRVHLLSKNGYSEATFEIPLYMAGADGEERLSELRASTYSLEGGKVVQTKLAKENTFHEVMSSNITLVKFTLPAVREGSIVDVDYILVSNFIYALPIWPLQNDVPTLWSDYTLSVPSSVLTYAPSMASAVPFYMMGHSEDAKNFAISNNEQMGTMSLSSAVSTFRWVVKDVPPFRREPFLYRASDHKGHLEFQITNSSLRAGLAIPSWNRIAYTLIHDVSFGYQLDRNNNFFNDMLADVRAPNLLDEAHNAFRWIRDHIQCNQAKGIYLSDGGLRRPFVDRKGSVAEANLLLVALLRKLGHNAAPLVLCPRSNGQMLGAFPMMGKLNYVVAAVLIDKKWYYCDASKPRLGFNQLEADCYNGLGMIIADPIVPADLTPGALLEKKTTVFLLNSTEDKQLKGSMQQLTGQLSAYDARGEITEKGKAAYSAGWQKQRPDYAHFSNIQIDSIDRFDGPLYIKSDVAMDLGDDIIYLDPLFGEGIKDNPFKAPERNYPVQFNSAINELVMLTFFVPDGYEADQLPESKAFAMNEKKDAIFKYVISKNEKTITLSVELQVKRALFEPEDYPYLREFYNMVVAKEQEKIVLKKTK